MRRRAVVALGLGAAVGLHVPRVRATGDAELQPWSGEAAAPPLELRDIDGRRVSLGSFAGRVVLVNFWATWCEPCVDELPSMQALRDRLATAPFEILAVNYMEGEPRIRGFLRRLPVRFPILRDTDGAVAMTWGARVLPASYLLDARGNRRFAVRGSLDWAATAAHRPLRALLVEAAGAR